MICLLRRLRDRRHDQYEFLAVLADWWSQTVGESPFDGDYR
jgi:hypothetical protein